jgi:DNA excision repair protein ERCC-3
VDLPEATASHPGLPEAGSRQEEAQRLGRLLLRRSRAASPPTSTRWWHGDTVDQDFAQNRQRFLAEQGYSYTILDGDAIAA